MSKEKETDLPEEKKQAIRPEELRIGNLLNAGKVRSVYYDGSVGLRDQVRLLD